MSHQWHWYLIGCCLLLSYLSFSFKPYENTFTSTFSNLNLLPFLSLSHPFPYPLFFIISVVTLRPLLPHPFHSSSTVHAWYQRSAGNSLSISSPHKLLSTGQTSSSAGCLGASSRDHPVTCPGATQDRWRTPIDQHTSQTSLPPQIQGKTSQSSHPKPNPQDSQLLSKTPSQPQFKTERLQEQRHKIQFSALSNETPWTFNVL